MQVELKIIDQDDDLYSLTINDTIAPFKGYGNFDRDGDLNIYVNIPDENLVEIVESLGYTVTKE